MSIVVLLLENRDCVFFILYVKMGVQKNQEISRGIKRATENVFLREGSVYFYYYNYKYYS